MKIYQITVCQKNENFHYFYQFANDKINQDVINIIEEETRDQANSKL